VLVALKLCRVHIDAELHHRLARVLVLENDLNAITRVPTDVIIRGNVRHVSNCCGLNVSGAMVRQDLCHATSVVPQVYGVIDHAAPPFSAVSMHAGKVVILTPCGLAKTVIRRDAVKFAGCLVAVDMVVRLLVIP
jgi:hypothetical protein